MHQKPRLCVEDVPDVVSAVYGLAVAVVREMDSYDDRVYLVREATPTQADGGQSHGYVFKVLNASDSVNPDIVDVQTQISLFVNNRGFPTSCPVQNLEGDYQKLVTLPKPRKAAEESEWKEEQCIVRLFQFIPGTSLTNVTLTTDLCQQIGEFAAKLNTALETFTYPDNAVLSKLVNKWNLSQVPRLYSSLHVIKDEEQRTLVGQVFTDFEKQILNHQEMFSKGIIHSDFNDENILVSEDSSKPPQIVGIIDFGDCTQTLYIFEVAIAIMYAMLNTSGVPPMEAAAKILAGYCQHRELTCQELKILKLSVCARFAQSLTIGLYASSLNPSDEHVMRHAQRIWPHLKDTWMAPDEEIYNQFIKYCKF